jgi:hypothetical protein
MVMRQYRGIFQIYPEEPAKILPTPSFKAGHELKWMTNDDQIQKISEALTHLGQYLAS